MEKTHTISYAVRQKYYPSLNGLRGISILLVVIYHLDLSNNNFYTHIFNGPLGVDIFFVLSGFLITTLCLKEKALTGKLSLKDFYIRRVLRILPVAYLYLLVAVLLNYFFKLGFPPFQFLGALFFLMDFKYFRTHQFTWIVGHFWSVSVEEQFYIIFPVILRKSLRAFFFIIVIIVFLLPFVYQLIEAEGQLDKFFFKEFIHYFIKFQAIAIGCFLAVLSFNKRLDFDFLQSRKLILNVFALIIIFYLGYDPIYSVKAVYTNLIIGLLTGLIIVTNITPAHDVIYKILNGKILSFIGILSYSIYLWHYLFVYRENRLPHYMTMFPLNLIFIAIVSYLSYFYYEKYFLKLKSKLSISK